MQLYLFAHLKNYAAKHTAMQMRGILAYLTTVSHSPQRGVFRYK